MATRLVHFNGIFGGSGVSSVIRGVRMDFDLVAEDPVRGLRPVVVELLDPDGATLARIVPPIAVSVVLPERDADHNDVTRPFDGSAEPGATLRLRMFPSVPSLPHRWWEGRAYRATFRDDQDRRFVLDGRMNSAWATAGPVAR